MTHYLTHDEVDYKEMEKEVERIIKSMPEYGITFVLDGPIKCEPWKES